MTVAALLLLAALRAVAAAVDKCYWAGPRAECGYPGITQDICEERGCCWVPVDFHGGPSADLPWCFHSNTAPSEYKLERDTHSVGAGGQGLAGTLLLSQAAQKELGPDVAEAALEVTEVSEAIVRVRITDARTQRWEVPTHLFRSDLLQGVCRAGAAAHQTAGAGGSDKKALYEVAIEDSPFSFQVLRRGEGRAVFNTTSTRLVFKDQYLELTTWVHPATHLFGAGERSSEELAIKRNGLPLTVWAHDLGPTFLQQNMYGAHPWVMAVEEDGTAWGALLFNSNGMDVVATNDRLSWRAIGGVIDLFVFLGPTPLAVMDQFTALVGRPALMPYWSLGWHQCKYGYKSVWEVEEVVANYSTASIPLETIWTDIDHMDRWMDFTFHPTNYPLKEMQRFVEELHAKGQRWVPIVDPGIKVEKGYAPYEKGIEQDVFMRGIDGRPYLGWVWPGACHFPDFFHPTAQDYFAGLLEEHHGLVPWDGIWIDMDEISNFCTGDICELHKQPNATSGQALSVSELRDDPPWVCQLDCITDPQGLNATMHKLLHPPYQIANYLNRAPLGTKGMSVLAYHHDGSLQYDTHNLYSLSEVKVTAEAVQSIRGKRPFVLTRGSFTGAGAYAAHWTGDNAATWHDLVWSLPGVLNIGLFGMPMGGADICGFQGDTTEELCARWIAVGAFYPFSRDHSDLHSGYQELYRWPMVAETGRRVLGMRYQLLPYIYTAFQAAHESGAPVMRPLWMNFPENAKTHGISRQFMLGDALLVTPVLEEGASKVEGYFPQGLWYSVWDRHDAVDARYKGLSVELEAPLGTIPLHMLGGTILPMQRTGMTTSEVKASPLTLVVALPWPAEPAGAAGEGGARRAQQRASGRMYNDDGESAEAGTSPCNFLTFEANVDRDPVGNAHRGRLTVQFGRPGQGAPCGAAGASDGGWEWPPLSAVEVLGWWPRVATARVEVTRPSDACGGEAEVVQSVEVDNSQVVVQAGRLMVDLEALALKLECPQTVTLTWASGEQRVRQEAVAVA